jgi:alpha-tubulin suppressor-like RCC1 family protein
VGPTKRATFQNKLLKLTVGTDHMAVLSTTGQVYSWGDGSYGQLGNGSTSYLKEPKMIEKLKGIVVKDIACSRLHTVMLTDYWPSLLLSYFHKLVTNNFCLDLNWGLKLTMRS